MNKLKYLLIVIIGLLWATNVYANDIESIKMDIYVDQNGDAHVKEEWVADLNEGTEGYKPYYNLGQSQITDYTVTMNGKNFSTLNYWDVDASFYNKSYKAGINKITDGYELCFGISEYGTNKYIMNYTITNFVSQTADADMIYWQLIPYNLSDKPEYVYVKIYSDFSYADDLPVWGYGYGDSNNHGYAYVYDGYIELSKDGSLDSDEYVTVLVKFPKNTFNTSSVLNDDFNHYYEMAQKGAKNYMDKPENFFQKSIKFIVTIIAFIFTTILNFLPMIIIFLVAIFSSRKNMYGTKNIKFSKQAKNIKDAPYFRDIPCNKDIFKAYWVACQYKLVKKNTDFLGSILLKWLKNKNIENVKVNAKEEKALQFNNKKGLNELEIKIYDMMVEASKDGILESEEFKHWCKIHYKKILRWFNEVIDSVTMTYVSEGLILEEKKAFGKVYMVNDQMREQGLQMAGLKKFLNDFSNIKEREAIEVKIWDEYLIYAQIFGIANKVAKEFKKLYPDVITDDYYNDIIFINTLSYNGMHAASAAKSAAESRASSYSSGGGGFSSSGGGGGSFGGGGGGGGFR